MGENSVDVSNQLEHAELSYITNSDCISQYGFSDSNITDNMICASNYGVGSCEGDDGGPLYDSENNVLVGVISDRNNCGTWTYPGVYSRISSQVSKTYAIR